MEAAKVNPGNVNYAHTGAGGMPHLAGELFQLRIGTKLNAVPYRGGGDYTTALLSKAVDATFGNFSIRFDLVQVGKLRALGVLNRTRSPLLPDVPTMAEAGVPDCEVNTFNGLLAPAGTPPNIIKKISDAMNEGLATAEIQKLMLAHASEAKHNTPAEFAAYIAARLEKWVEVGKAAGLKVN